MFQANVPTAMKSPTDTPKPAIRDAGQIILYARRGYQTAQEEHPEVGQCDFGYTGKAIQRENHERQHWHQTCPSVSQGMNVRNDDSGAYGSAAALSLALCISTPLDLPPA